MVAKELADPAICRVCGGPLPYFGRRDLVQVLHELEPLLEPRKLANMTEELLDRDDRASKAYARVCEVIAAVERRCNAFCGGASG